MSNTPELASSTNRIVYVNSLRNLKQSVLRRQQATITLLSCISLKYHQTSRFVINSTRPDQARSLGYILLDLTADKSPTSDRHHADMVQQTGQVTDKPLTNGRADSHMVEAPALSPAWPAFWSSCSRASRGVITEILLKKGVYPMWGGPGYPGVGAWGVRVGESPRKNIIKNEVGV